MLLELRLTAFKCFADLALPLRPLTLLAGVNGGGKSTVLQALLLLHQALADTPAPVRTTLPLNGGLLCLGSVRDVIHKGTGGRTFRIEVSTGTTRVSWWFLGRNPPDDLAAALDRTIVDRLDSPRASTTMSRILFPSALAKADEGRDLRRLLAHIQYVPADRFGPVEAFPLLEPGRHQTLGPRAERAVGALHWRRDDDVAVDDLRHPDRTRPPRIVRQVEAWLADLFPAAILDVQRVPNTNLVTLGLGTSESIGFHRPQHVGFGMTYALPILVALLGAAPGDLVIIENPEAHLHPRAQVGIIGLCVRAARSGIQVLIETHSDHVLNGVRVAVHRGNIAPDKVGIHYFERPLEGGSRHREVRLQAGGRLEDRPDGFLDEMERQLMELLEPAEGNG